MLINTAIPPLNQFEYMGLLDITLWNNGIWDSIPHPVLQYPLYPSVCVPFVFEHFCICLAGSLYAHSLYGVKCDACLNMESIYYDDKTGGE